MNKEKKEKLRNAIFATLKARLPERDSIEIAYHAEAILNAIERV